MQQDSISTTLACLRGYADLLDQHGVTRAAAVATSASRDAANGQEVMVAIADVLGFAPEVIDGRREARLAHAGAAAGRGGESVTVIDIGGGSTEITSGVPGAPTDVHSYDIGSVRITDRHLTSLPARPDAVSEARRDAAATFADHAPIRHEGAVVGVAGTFTTLSAVHLGLDGYDRDAVDGSVLGTDDIARLEARFSAMSADDIAAIPSMDPARAPVILGGTIVARAALDAVGAASIIVSEHDLLDGLADELRIV